MTGDDAAMDAWLERMSRRFPSARSPGVAPDAHDASAREGSTREELEREAGTLSEQFRDEFASLQVAGVPPTELQDLRNRFNSFYGRVRATTGLDELRRVLTDLRAVLRDVQDRNRELPEAGLAGDVDIVEEVEVDRAPQPASTRADATVDELIAQLREVDGRAEAVYEALRGRVSERDHRAFAARRRTLREILSRESQPSAPELRRAITDAYDLLSDLQARDREAGGAGASGAGASGGAVPNDLQRLHALAQRRLAQLRRLLRDEPTEVDNYIRQLNSLVPRIRSGDKDELERCAVDLRGFLEDIERRLRTEAARRRDAR